MLKYFAAFAFLSAPTPSLAQPTSPWPAVREFGGATPLRMGSWVSFSDYPSDALGRNEQGNVIVKFDIDVTGRARNCFLDTSSGSPRLDTVPCKLIEARARFKPATSPDGTPTPTKGRYSVAFWTPE